MRISVFIPNYNHGHLLDVCINLYLIQSVKPHEIIIVDDRSTDNSIEIIENLILKHKNHCNLKLIKNIVNIGIHDTVINNCKM
jgi:glycosyltransferase involved in cell wall biosynthesis